MYAPARFAEDRPEVLAEAIRTAGLATLVTYGRTGIAATHAPILLDPSCGPHGTLIGHIARANPQWRDPDPGVHALAIFAGPEAYVTPSWYPAKQEHGRVVPTWNYVAVHAHGPIAFFHDPERLHDAVRRLTEKQEHSRAAPWAVSDAPAEYIDGMLKGIVGFALTIARLEGTWKLSQNRDKADRQGVARGLADDGRPEIAAMIPTGDA